jgi:hypothetical protein
MLRQIIAPVITLLCLFPLTQSAQGEEFIPIRGALQFFHKAVDPGEAEYCESPAPGLLFKDVTGEFFGKATVLGKFMGKGSADVCAFFQPLFGVYAQYTGSHTWVTEDGLILHGEFFGVDIEPFVFDPETGLPLVFETLIFITLTDDDGQFMGTLFARGIDDPFGVLSGDPSLAGVSASFTGRIRR